MDLSQLVPLYLTIIMIILVVLAMVGPGDKENKEDSSSDKE